VAWRLRDFFLFSSENASRSSCRVVVVARVFFLLLILLAILRACAQRCARLIFFFFFSSFSSWCVACTPPRCATVVASMYLHGGLVELAVGLAARAPHGGAFAAVEHAEVDRGLVRDAAHHAVQRVHLDEKRVRRSQGEVTGRFGGVWGVTAFVSLTVTTRARASHLPDEVTLPDAADRRVTAELADRIEALRHEEGLGPRARRRRGRLAPGMAAPDDHLFICGRVVRLSEGRRPRVGVGVALCCLGCSTSSKRINFSPLSAAAHRAITSTFARNAPHRPQGRSARQSRSARAVCKRA